MDAARVFRFVSLVAFGLTAAPSLALAGPPPSNSLDAELPPPAIYGGEPTATCGWPTTVSIAGGCTGTLVHPRVVTYAAHCGSQVPWVFFGERVSDMASGRRVEVERCETYPGFNNIGEGTDFAYCLLAEPVDDIAIVPVLMGCETELLQPGTEVVAVGFGFDENNQSGIKQEVSFPIIEVGDEVRAGGDGKSICNGDSGGPLFLRLPPELDPERSWRVFGVTSWGPFDCAEPQYFGMLHRAVPWIEQRTGIDITPCHNSDGSWQAGPECGRFPTEPATSHGDWAGSCGDEPIASEAATTCGEPAVAEDIDAPTVSIVSPADGSVFTSDRESGSFALEVEADVSDLGWGIERVQLLVDGEAIPNGERRFAPFSWSGAFPSGGYVLEVEAVDRAGNITMSAPAHIGIDQDPPEPAAGETGDEAGASEGGGCRSSGTPAPLAVLALGLALAPTLGRRRR